MDIAHGFCTNLIDIKGNLNPQCYADEILARHIIPPFQNNANITLFQHDNAISHTGMDTVNFLRPNNNAFIDWLAKSPDLNPTEHLWDNLDQGVRHCPIPPPNVIQLRQALIQEMEQYSTSQNQHTYPMMPGSPSC